jgi:hypothetical protein
MGSERVEKTSEMGALVRSYYILELRGTYWDERETMGIAVEVALGAPGGGSCQRCGSIATDQKTRIAKVPDGKGASRLPDRNSRFAPP